VRLEGLSKLGRGGSNDLIGNRTRNLPATLTHVPREKDGMLRRRIYEGDAESEKNKDKTRKRRKRKYGLCASTTTHLSSFE
jgi:hypothetical protein